MFCSKPIIKKINIKMGKIVPMINLPFGSKVLYLSIKQKLHAIVCNKLIMKENNIFFIFVILTFCILNKVNKKSECKTLSYDKILRLKTTIILN